MSQAIIGALRAELSAGVARFADDMGKAAGEVSKFSKKFKDQGAAISEVGGKLSLFVSGPIAALGVSSVRAFQDSEKAIAAVDAAIASMGTTAGYTSADLQEMAAGLQAATTFDDDEILSKVTANLLTFGNVQGEVFARAQKSALDLSARLGQDLQSSAIQLGKALNDPIKGITALSRVGVSFTEQQKAMIKSMVAAGDVAGAQGLILSELEKQYGGQAAALAKTSQGQMQQLANSWGDFKEVVGEVVARILPPLIEMLRGLVGWLSRLDPSTVAWGVALAGIVAAIGPVVLGVGALISGFGGLLSAFALVMKAGPAFIGMAKAIGVAVSLMGGPVTALIAVLAALAAAWVMYGDEITAYVSGWIERIDLALGGGLSAVIEAAKAVVGGFVEHVKLTFQLLGQILTGDWTGALETFKAIWANSWGRVVGIVAETVGKVGDWLKNKLGAIFDWVGQKIETVKGYFQGLYQAVVGGSYIPDMVDGIIAEMDRLEDGFVAPAEQMTAEVGASFEGLQSQVAGVFDELIANGKVSSNTLRTLFGSVVGQMFGIGNVFSPSTPGGGGGSLGGIIASGIGSFLAGGLAGGGLALAGRPYLVGERGMELFRPHVTGTVDPNPGGAGGVTQIFNVSTPDSNSFRRSERQIMRSARQRLTTG